MTVREFLASPIWVLGTFNVLALTALTVWVAMMMTKSLEAWIYVGLIWVGLFLVAFGNKAVRIGVKEMFRC